MDSRRAAAGSRHKADGVQAPEGSSPGCDSGECAGHHRGLRAGQVFRGGTRERGSTTWSPRTTPGVGDRVTTGPGVTWGLHPGHEPDEDTTNAVKQARYREASDQRSDPRGAGGSLSGAEDRCRWGTAPHGTHGREGNAGHHVVWRDLWERRRAHQPSPCNARAWRNRPNAPQRGCATPCCT